jgi:2-polyprenyl-6-methoxyphenol hydroxylase-like FAD-dependent oxidoreductase
VVKVIICGAGIAGLTLAERLSALGADVVLLERSAAPRTSGYMIDFFGAGYEAAEAIGVLPAIEEVSYRIGDAGLVDQHGRRRGDLPHQQIAKALDGRLCSVMRSDLEGVLRDKLPGSVDVRFGTSVAEVSQQDDRVTVTLDDGAELDADLLVGADGIHSAVRALVFGDDREQLKYLGFHFAAFEIDASDLPDPPGDRFVCTDALDRQLSFYVLRDGRAAVSAVYRPSGPDLAGDARAALRDRYDGMGWLVPEVLERCPTAEDICYDQAVQIEMPRWSENRVVLIGDACAAVSPLAAHGASLALGSAYVLAEQLRLNSSVDRAVNFYERLWRWVIDEKQHYGRDAAGWTLPASPGQGIRRGALRLTWSPLVKRFIAATLAGEPHTVVTQLRRGTSDPEGSTAMT